MKKEIKQNVLAGILIILTFFLISYYFKRGNMEYVYYGILTLLITIPVVIFLMKKTNFPLPLIYGIGFLMIVNLCAGGIISINGKILYEWMPIRLYVYSNDFAILKFDQIVHAYGAFICTLSAYYILINKNKENKYDHPIFLLGLLLIGFGAASFYEVVEFVSKRFGYNAVGEYYNTVLDLCANFLGAIVGVLTVAKESKK